MPLHRRPSGTVHHSDKGSQYVSLAYTQRLKEAGLLASTGSTGDSYDNAMAESINGLYKAEVIHRKSWKNRAEVELATLTWVDWYNNRRLLERLGHTPPAEAEKLIMLPSETMIWQPEFTDKTLSRKPGVVQPTIIPLSASSVWSRRVPYVSRVRICATLISSFSRSSLCFLSEGACCTRS